MIEGSYFSKTYCLSLPRSTGRRKRLDQQIADLKLDIEYFYGKDWEDLDKAGRIRNLYKNNLALLKHGILANDDRFIYLEDDAVFSEDFVKDYLKVCELLERVVWDAILFFPRKGSPEEDLKLDLLKSEENHLAVPAVCCGITREFAITLYQYMHDHIDSSIEDAIRRSKGRVYMLKKTLVRGSPNISILNSGKSNLAK